MIFCFVKDLPEKSTSSYFWDTSWVVVIHIQSALFVKDNVKDFYLEIKDWKASLLFSFRIIFLFFHPIKF